MCTIGKVQGKAALAVAASHRKLGLRAVCVYQHQPVTGYDIGIHHHVQGDIDLGNHSLPNQLKMKGKYPNDNLWQNVNYHRDAR